MTHRLSGAQFEALWFLTGRDRMPYPLRYVRERVATEADLAEARRAVTAGLPALLDESLAEAFAALDAPDFRVEARGFRGPGPVADIRVLAAVRGGSGAVATQPPELRGDIAVTRCLARDVGRLVAAALPDVPAGRRDDLRIPRARLADEPPEDAAWNRPLTPSERVERIFGGRRDCWGWVSVAAGPAWDNRPDSDGVEFGWLHLPGDGGYFITADAMIQARPMSRGQTAQAVDDAVRLLRDRAALRR